LKNKTKNTLLANTNAEQAKKPFIWQKNTQIFTKKSSHLVCMKMTLGDFSSGPTDLEGFLNEKKRVFTQPWNLSLLPQHIKTFSE